MAKFVIKRTADYEHRFNLIASNGKVILTSETYNSLEGVKRGIEAVKKHSGEDSWYDKHEARDGKSYFTMKATNGKVIGTSQRYRSKSGMYKGIRAVKKAARNAEVIDLTKSKAKARQRTFEKV